MLHALTPIVMYYLKHHNRLPSPPLFVTTSFPYDSNLAQWYATSSSFSDSRRRAELVVPHSGTFREERTMLSLAECMPSAVSMGIDRCSIFICLALFSFA